METATFGSGCFWCTEAVFQQLKGVSSVVPGYSGGHVVNPTYQQVCTGRTGHAEVCQIQFDPEQISFEELLEVFFNTHDPTTLNRQGNDVGAQYRSVIFYHSDEQQKTAEKVKAELDRSGKWKNPIVTEIVPFEEFYKAEDYHQNYFRDNPDQGYCRLVIAPKLDKFEKVFKLKIGK
jgi:peptide-methionine (S)-S-oxide reductase